MSRLSSRSASSTDVRAQGAAYPSPRSRAPAPTHVLSGTSRRNQLRTKPTHAIAAAYRKIAVIESEYAPITRAAVVAGRPATSRGLPCRAAGSNPRGRAIEAMLTASWDAKMEPKMDTPNEPPIERKNVADEVATPRSA